SNYGLVYSGKVVGAVCAPLGAAFVDANGYSAAYIVAGAIGLGSALLVLTLRRPRVPAGAVPAGAGPTGAVTARAALDAERAAGEKRGLGEEPLFVRDKGFSS
ncbi:MAG: hypothetical protein J2P26_12865, partial [Nocardiopsaceae bacterium]|nr:hypothetical protein [Nocardiopsaceae bacterium]